MKKLVLPFLIIFFLNSDARAASPAEGSHEEKGSSPAQEENSEGPACKGLRDQAYSWGPQTGLLLSGRLQEPCQDFSIRVRDVDSDKSVILKPTMKPSVFGEEGTGSYILRFKDPDTSVLEISFQSDSQVGPKCLVSRQPDPSWRLMCESPHPGEPESAFWLASLGLGSTKEKKLDKDKKALGNLWAGGLVWRVSHRGSLLIQSTVVGEGSSLPSEVGCRVTLMTAVGEAPLVARSRAQLAGSFPRLAGACDLELPLPSWLLDRRVEVVYEVDPHDDHVESLENDNATVTASLLFAPSSEFKLLAGGMTAGARGTRLGGVKGKSNLSFENLSIRKTKKGLEVSGALILKKGKGDDEISGRLRVTVTGLLGFSKMPARAQVIEVTVDPDQPSPVKFSWPLNFGTDSSGPDTRSLSLALQIDPADKIQESDESDNELSCTVTLGALDNEPQPFCSQAAHSDLMGFLRLPGFQEGILLGESLPIFSGRNLGDLRFVLPEKVWGQAGHMQVRGTLVREPGKKEKSGEKLSIPIRFRYLTGNKVAAEAWVTAGMETGLLQEQNLWVELFVPDTKAGRTGVVEIAIDPDNRFPEDEEQNNLIFLKTL